MIQCWKATEQDEEEEYLLWSDVEKQQGNMMNIYYGSMLKDNRTRGRGRIFSMVRCWKATGEEEEEEEEEEEDFLIWSDAERQEGKMEMLFSIEKEKNL